MKAIIPILLLQILLVSCSRKTVQTVTETEHTDTVTHLSAMQTARHHDTATSDTARTDTRSTLLHWERETITIGAHGDTLARDIDRRRARITDTSTRRTSTSTETMRTAAQQTDTATSTSTRNTTERTEKTTHARSGTATTAALGLVLAALIAGILLLAGRHNKTT